ncbi:hypothetical protein PR048_006141 [Dryococelus australis]|uniref:Uncharacterized protein n=1 Tax=Dryococelus australis TaxID=614101 RepID=A0ABQ9ICC0_9NEOP|nr:hypothetical protein PR048_006141 [Dryococelus australis]
MIPVCGFDKFCDVRILTLIIAISWCYDGNAYAHGNKDFNVTGKLAHLFELGRKAYENIQKEGETSPCWTESMTYMVDGCKNLTEYVQMNIALKYSDCFVTSCGLQSHGCSLLIGENRKRCIKSMSSKGYNAYAGFFVSLQNICLFLESERWHNRTQVNVNNLVAISSLLMHNLEESSKFKSSLIHSQRQTIYLQSKFRRNLSTLKQIFTKYEMAWNSTVKKYVSVSQKQEKLVLTIYDVFSVLNEWTLDRYYWLGTVTFYIASVAIMCAFTVQPKARHVRFPLVLVLTCNVVVEKLLYLSMFQRKIITEAVDLYHWVWMTRKIAILLCVFLFFTSGRNFSEQNLFTHKWITRINNHLHALLVSVKKCNTNSAHTTVRVLNSRGIQEKLRQSSKTLPDR